LEVTKTTMAANRGDSFAKALSRIWARGGVLGCMFPQPFLSSNWFANFYCPVQSTKVSSPGPGSKPPPKAQSCSSSPPKENTTPVPSVPRNLQLVSVVVSWAESHRHMRRWVSAPV
jgi:hypothetical protein